VIFLFTKPLVTLLAKNKYFQAGGKYSGVSPHSIGLVNQVLESKGA
jgi:preprotein translocase subunit SecD